MRRLDEPAPAFIIRESTEGDVAALAAICAHHVRGGLGSSEEAPPAAAEIARRRAEVPARRLPYLAAAGPAGAVLGVACASSYRARSAYRFSLEDPIYRARCRPPWHRPRPPCRAHRPMVAIIGDSGNAGSIGRHKQLGFRQVGLLPAIGFKHGRWVDSVLMQRRLGSGSTTFP